MDCFLACAAHAQIPESNPTAFARLAEERQIIDQLSPLLNQFQVIQNDEIQTARKWGDLRRSGAQIKKQAKEHNADSAKFAQATANHEARADSEETQRLVAWGKRLSDEQVLLKKAIADHVRQAEAIRTEHDENNARMDKIRAALQPLFDRLRAIQMDACNDVARNASDEAARATCNQMLDGNQ